MEELASIYPIYKEKGPSSHWVVNQIRKITGIRKVGHAGTLDPLASGVLVIGITRQGTKQMDTFVQKEKEYLADVRLGETSTTDDAEGEKTVVSTPGESIPDYDQVNTVVQKFEGTVMQIPPIYSALKIKGKSAYKYAREGKNIEMKPRSVIIPKIEILSYAWPDLRLRVVTGPGVYIRSLARDIGEDLGTGGYLAELERTRVGQYRKEDALTLEQFQKAWKKQKNME